jgi:hypothetical protein
LLASFRQFGSRTSALSCAPTIDKAFNTIVSDSLLFNAIDKVFYILDQFTNKKPQWGVRELSIKIGLTPNLRRWVFENPGTEHAVRKDSNIPLVLKSVLKAAAAISCELGWKEKKWAGP